MNKIIITLTAFAAFTSVVMPAIGGEPIGPVLSNPTTSDQDALILRILKAVETHDYRTLLIYTLDKETDYFGHKNSSNAFIQKDMTQDAQSYKWCRFVPDLSTYQTSLGHDSIEYDSDALDVRGKAHKARCRLDIYYTPTTSPRLRALSLKVLPNHQQSGNSGSTVTGPDSGQDDESSVENAVAQCTEIIKTKIIPQYETKDGFSVKPLDIKYQDDPAIAKWIHGSIWKQLDPVSDPNRGATGWRRRSTAGAHSGEEQRHLPSSAGTEKNLGVLPDRTPNTTGDRLQPTGSIRSLMSCLTGVFWGPR